MHWFDYHLRLFSTKNPAIWFESSFLIQLTNSDLKSYAFIILNRSCQILYMFMTMFIVMYMFKFMFMSMSVFMLLEHQ